MWVHDFSTHFIKMFCTQRYNMADGRQAGRGVVVECIPAFIRRLSDIHSRVFTVLGGVLICVTKINNARHDDVMVPNLCRSRALVRHFYCVWSYRFVVHNVYNVMCICNVYVTVNVVVLWWDICNGIRTVLTLCGRCSTHWIPLHSRGPYCIPVVRTAFPWPVLRSYCVRTVFVRCSYGTCKYQQYTTLYYHITIYIYNHAYYCSASMHICGLYTYYSISEKNDIGRLCGSCMLDVRFWHWMISMVFR